MVGTTLGAAGLALVGWVLLRLMSVEWAFDSAFWILSLSGLSFVGGPEGAAYTAINRPSMLFVFLAVFLSLIAWFALSAASVALRPPNESNDGEMVIALDGTNPVVGVPLAGRVILKGSEEPTGVFHLLLSCRRQLPMREGGRGSLTLFNAEDNVRAVRGADGWSLPFCFEIPSSAPPSGNGDFGCPEWSLTVVREKKWFGSTFELTLYGAWESDMGTGEIPLLPEEKAPPNAAGVAMSESDVRMGEIPLLPEEKAPLDAVAVTMDTPGQGSGPRIKDRA